MYESSIVLRKAIDFFDYVPIILQTDNNWEFSETVKRDKKAPNARKYPNY